jgi:plasmid stability protein
MNLTLKDVPAELHRKLKRRAEQNHRSLNLEVIDILERVVDPKPVNVEELLAEARQLRESVPDLLITDPLLRKAKDWGRQ